MSEATDTGKHNKQPHADKGDTKEELDPTQYYEARTLDMLKLKEQKETNPYPHKFEVGYSVPNFNAKYAELCKENNVSLEEIVTLAARVMNIRASGKNLIFYDLHQSGEKVQGLCRSNDHTGGLSFEETHAHIKRGDIIGLTGKPGRSKTGELSIFVTQAQLLSPCLHMLPSLHTGLKDHETRYRKRYLDLMINSNVRQTFITRSKVISFIRRYLDNLNFLEIETPILNTIAGGATARPFTTHHNELDMQLYMRIAPELFHKMLVVGGLERVYEIGKQFRNEGIDATHNPEYTSTEFYMAYADCEDLVKLTEDLLSKMVFEIKGTYKFTIHQEIKGEVKEIELDFTPPFKRLNMMEELEKRSQTQLPADYSTPEARTFFDDLAIKYNVECRPPRTTARLIDKLVGHFLEPECVNPTFITHHPQILSPLAKYHRDNPQLTERFELFINNFEIVNAFTELNDPFVQRQIFVDQVKQRTAGDDEAMQYDEGYCTALEHALPPTAGWGMGIDSNIQEVLLFPAMKPIINKPASSDVKKVETEQPK